MSRARDLVRILDGFAACNLEEPSPGDLKRVYTAYSACFDKMKRLEQALELAKNFLQFECGNRCSDLNPCNSRCGLVEIESILEEENEKVP
jgi:hypothetical protein